MDYTTLGRTGLRVSVAGLGTGGFSRVGIGQSEDHAVGIIRQALDLGVNLIDTAAVYGTEEVVGRALKDVPRDSVVVCTKASKPINDPAFTVKQILESLDGSLKRLGMDHVDVFQLHAVPPAAYDYVRNEIVPALLREKQKGKFRFLGITETSPNDHEHGDVAKGGGDGGYALGHGDVRVQPDGPGGARGGVSSDTEESRGHADDVRGAQHLRASGATGRHDEGPRGERTGAGGTGGER